jgi:RNA polymerase sigma-70 factor (ECF subfamily)
MTVRVDLVEELINDTMFEVWKEGASIGATGSVFLAIIGLAYSRVQKYLAESGPDEPHSPRDVSPRDVQDREPSKSLLTTDTLSDLQFFLIKLPVEERAVVHLVYGSGCSRREIAGIMKIACDCVDVLLSDVRASAKQHFSVTSAQAQGIDPGA